MTKQIFFRYQQGRHRCKLIAANNFRSMNLLGCGKQYLAQSDLCDLLYNESIVGGNQSAISMNSSFDSRTGRQKIFYQFPLYSQLNIAFSLMRIVDGQNFYLVLS